MTSRIKILLALTFLLGGAVFFWENPFQKKFTHSSDLFYPNLKKENIAKIDIDYFTHGTQLIRTNNNEWMADALKTDLALQLEAEDKKKKPDAKPEEPFPADPEQVDNLIEPILNLTKGDVISSNPDKQAQFQVAKVGLQLKFYDAQGKILAHLHVGKQGPNVFSTFVRDDSSNDIHLVTEALLGINKPLDEWRKKENTEEKAVNE